MGKLLSSVPEELQLPAMEEAELSDLQVMYYVRDALLEVKVKIKKNILEIAFNLITSNNN
jgi:hypothetical protein